MSPSRREFVKLSGASVLAGLLSARHSFARQLQAQEMDFANLADAYALEPGITYLNHGSIGTMPCLVLEAMCRYLEICESNPWLHVWGEAWQPLWDEVRVKAAVLMGCSAAEMTFTRNTTEAFCLLANGLPLFREDEVVFSTLNHVGASACWFHVAEERGFAVRRFDVPLADIDRLTEDEIIALYDGAISERTRVLVLPHIDNLVGLRHPVRQIAALAHDRGVEWVAVDGAQSLGMIPVGVKALGVDFFASSPHKWIQAPKGTGLLYVRDDLHEIIRPTCVTWGQEIWKDSTRRFEDFGTRDLARTLALGDAIDFQSRLGDVAREARQKQLWEQVCEEVQRTEGLTWHSPTRWQQAASLYSIGVEGKSSKEVFDHLYGKHGFVFRALSRDDLDAMRLSPNVFNSEQEIESFFAVLRAEVL